MPQRYDVAIAGAGHNGLVAAAYLARAGRRVIVLEKRPMAGGCSVTEELWPGYRVSSAAYLTSLLQERIIRDLDLPRHGYYVYPKDPASFSPFPDGRYLFFWRDRERTLTEIAKFSPRDAERFPAYEDHLTELAALISRLLLVIPPTFPPAGARDWVDWIRTAARLRGVSRPQTLSLVKIFTQSAAEFLSDWFDSEAVRVTLATDGVIGANGGPRSPGTAYVLLHHCMGQVAGHTGLWGFVRGGMGAVSEAIASAAREHGAEIRCDAGVERVLVRDGQARGVVLQNGDEIEAETVASNLDPKHTFLRLLSAADLPDEFRHTIGRFRCEGTSLKINFALDSLPEFACLPGAPGPQHGSTIHLCPSIDSLERAWDDAKYGRPSVEPLVELTIPTIYDDSLAPAGKHVMGAFVQYAPYTLAEGSWDDLREPYGDHVVKLIEQYLPGFGSRVLHRQVLSPLDLERRFGITGGNIFHGEMSVDQMFSLRPLSGWAKYRTPVRNLYLCGSGAHPGGGVMGAPGYNCAQVMLQDSKL